MSNAQPARQHVYQNHHLDSTRWDHVELRPSDIVISTAYKAGTTFTQTIVGNLIFWRSEQPEVLLSVSPIAPSSRATSTVSTTRVAGGHRPAITQSW
jgi:hypothetical protein